MLQRIKVDNREFVKVWMTSQSVDDVARRLGMTNTNVSAKASSLRSKGVKLPKKLFGGNRDFQSVGELNKLIEKYTKK